MFKYCIHLSGLCLWKKIGGLYNVGTQIPNKNKVSQHKGVAAYTIFTHSLFT
jgi:hypothetical protein